MKNKVGECAKCRKQGVEIDSFRIEGFESAHWVFSPICGECREEVLKVIREWYYPQQENSTYQCVCICHRGGIDPNRCALCTCRNSSNFIGFSQPINFESSSLLSKIKFAPQWVEDELSGLKNRIETLENTTLHQDVSLAFHSLDSLMSRLDKIEELEKQHVISWGRLQEQVKALQIHINSIHDYVKPE